MQLNRFIALCTALAAGTCQALLIRADRDDAEYLEMAARYTSTVPIDVPGGGEGVLIDARWILTSARVGTALEQMRQRPSIKVGGKDMKIQGVYVHPTWRPGADSADLTLVYLARPASVTPTPVYRGGDEAGKSVVIVGNGDTGKIGEKALRQDHRMRAGINTIDRLSPRVFMATVKSGDDASDLQAAFTAGESGAPAYYQDDSKELFVVGIASSAKDTNGDGTVDAGDSQVFVRVSSYADWIAGTIEQVYKDEVNDLLDGSSHS
ncbi:MAG TPA: trypsin-like serine protease [Usitatibacter sp.]|nr:trypsin-like serine protease [Usitatibacter sp.]